MKDYRLYKKRDGQGWNQEGSVCATSFDEAKKKFATTVYNDLMNGIHGDNYTHLTTEEDEVEEDGIYYNGELEISIEDINEGIDGYSNDVYRWALMKDSFPR